MILILNCGSQSIKWKFFDKDLKLKEEGKRDIFDSDSFEKILTEELNKLKEYNLKKIGHRVVHGGEKFREPLKITEKSLKELEKFNNLAPLHNPFNILGIKTVNKVFPEAEQVAVFDTGFYIDLPKRASTYALPEKLREEYGFSRFGFHGISHEYAAREGAMRIKKPFSRLKIISCHLGGGASITATLNGKPIDTSMGFTPLEGLVMMTRTGDIDPGIVLELCKELSTEKVNELLNSDSGIKGICGMDDMREVLKKVSEGNKKAELSLDVFVYRIKKYIGSYFAVLGGCDLLVFTGAIGSGSAKIRKMVCGGLKILKNTKILAIDTNEELAIAQKIKNA